MPEDKTRLTDEQVDAKLDELDGWSRDGIYLQKDYIFDNFTEINTFLPYMAETIVEQNHHPDLIFMPGDKKVSLKMTTHSEGGLTQSDIDLATALENWRH